jgi:hypothetical protein
MRPTTDFPALALVLALSGCWLSASLLSCGHDDGDGPAPAPAPTPTLDAAALRDPKACAACHPAHFEQWSMSMHAYAAEDPIFIAMNAKAQRETGGEIGDFCVKCHAPVAVKDGLTRDGLNLASLPASARGVTCFACHAVDRIDEVHNGGVHLSDDGVMRGGIADPLATAPHAAARSQLHTRDAIGSSSLCGACHDIKTHAGLDTATTFAEWQKSLFGHDIDGQRLTCGNCHMLGSQGLAAQVEGAPRRPLHDHVMPGVDVAITDFPGRDEQQALVQANLDPSLVAKLCVTPPHGDANVEVTLDNAFVGHSFPSGATYDRRVWVELVAYEKDQIVFQSGVVPPGTSVTSLEDPSPWSFRTRLIDASGAEVEFQWQAAKTESSFLSPAVTRDSADPAFYHASTRGYVVPPSADRITMRVLITPVALEVVDALIASGDLDASYRDALPIFTLGGTKLEWTTDKGFGCLP